MRHVTVKVSPVERRAWATVAIVAAAGALVSLDTMVNIAFPAITESFGIEVTEIQWVVTTYVLTFASLLLAAGRLGDAFGHRRVSLPVSSSRRSAWACAAWPTSTAGSSWRESSRGRAPRW